MTTETETHKVTDDGVVLVPVKLAHPMSKAYAASNRVEPVKDYPVGATIFVTREYGNAMIEAGLIAVDPLDTKARQRALLLNHRNQVLTPKEIEALVDEETGSTGEAAAGVSAPVEKQQSAADAPSKARAAGK